MFDLVELQAAVTAHARVARIVIAGFDGSSPREVGAAMLVWQGGQSGTIGGGALEHEATTRARAHLAATRPLLTREALGPKLGQCCGGAVTLLTEVFTQATLPAAEVGVFARPVFARPQRAFVGRKAVWQHRDHTVGEIHTVPAFERA